MTTNRNENAMTTRRDYETIVQLMHQKSEEPSKDTADKPPKKREEVP